MKKGVLCDTDFLIAHALAEESTHARARQLFTIIALQPWMVVTAVKWELATVLSRKKDHPTACRIFRDIIGGPITFISAEAHEEDIWKEFYSHTRKNISFVDCANVVIARKYGFTIASFDAFYPKELLA